MTAYSIWASVLEILLGSTVQRKETVPQQHLTHFLSPSKAKICFRLRGSGASVTQEAVRKCLRFLHIKCSVPLSLCNLSLFSLSRQFFVIPGYLICLCYPLHSKKMYGEMIYEERWRKCFSLSLVMKTCWQSSRVYEVKWPFGPF